MRKIICCNFVTIVVLFFAVDFCYTKFYFDANDVALAENAQSEKAYRVKHDVYHHTLKSNFNGYGLWGRKSYRICTDEHGFKISCYQKEPSGTQFDIAFIGDSFTEAVGMAYEDSFVGMFANRFNELKIANFGVSSYSPSIYLTKVKHILHGGIKFKHLVVFVDISDLQDDSTRYIINSKGSIPNLRKIANKIELNKPSAVRVLIVDNFRLTTVLYRYVRYDLFGPPQDLHRQSINISNWTYNSDSEGYGDLGVDHAIDLSINHMKELYKLIKLNDIKLSVGVYPWPDQIFNDKLIGNRQSKIWKDFCAYRCEMYIDLFPKFADLRRSIGAEKVYSRKYLNSDVHFNKSGNSLVFEALFESYSKYANQ
jgi:lysophospholipase L1-like esterase